MFYLYLFVPTSWVRRPKLFRKPVVGKPCSLQKKVSTQLQKTLSLSFNLIKADKLTTESLAGSTKNDVTQSLRFLRIGPLYVFLSWCDLPNILTLFVDRPMALCTIKVSTCRHFWYAIEIGHLSPLLIYCECCKTNSILDLLRISRETCTCSGIWE